MAAAGLKAGDVIIAVDGEEGDKEAMTRAAQALRNERIDVAPLVGGRGDAGLASTQEPRMGRALALEVDEAARLELEAVGQALLHDVTDLDALRLAEGLEAVEAGVAVFRSLISQVSDGGE